MTISELVEPESEIVHDFVSNRYLNVLNALLAGLVAIFLGMSVKDIYEFHEAYQVVPTSAGKAEMPQAQFFRPLQARNYYEAITQRDIFNLAPSPKPATEHEDLHIKLLGTSHLTRGTPFAIVEDQTGRQSLFRLGDAILGAGQLLEVGQDQVIVLHNGHRVVSKISRDATSFSELDSSPPGNLVIRGGRKMLMPGF